MREKGSDREIERERAFWRDTWLLLHMWKDGKRSNVLDIQRRYEYRLHKKSGMESEKNMQARNLGSWWCVGCVYVCEGGGINTRFLQLESDSP